MVIYNNSNKCHILKQKFRPHSQMKNIITICLLCLIHAGSTLAQDSQAPEFQLTTATGIISNHDLKGKVIYLDFWASWCHPCRKSFPWLNDMHARYGQNGLEIVAVNLDKDKSLADQFLKLLPANFNIAYDPETVSAKAFSVKGLPTSFLIDHRGDIRYQHKGFREKDKARLEQLIIQLLKETYNNNQ